MEPDRPTCGLVLVTGTDTGVGKTMVTAAIAAAATAAGRRVAVVKPAQTGTAHGEPSDAAQVARLADPSHTVTLVSYPDPVAPLVAAQFAGMAPLRLVDAWQAVRDLTGGYDLVLVEGAGGLLVPLGGSPGDDLGWNLLHLRDATQHPDTAEVVVVARAGLGTLNHTALTVVELARHDLPGSLVIGAWPDRPEPVHWANLRELAGGLRSICELDRRPDLVGVLPDGAGRIAPAAFRRAAPGWLAPKYGGTVRDWQDWAAGHST